MSRFVLAQRVSDTTEEKAALPVPAETKPIGRQRAREVVIERLRAWIIDGELQPGEVVKDSEIAATLGVSRTPVREALLHLEREGLIESQPGRWTRVAPLDASHPEKLYPVIIALETLSVQLAARNPEGLVEIEAAQQRFAAAVARFAETGQHDDARAVRAGDDAFHEAILRAASNEYLTEALLPLRTIARRFETWYFGRTPAIGAASVADHERILTALRAGDAEAAAKIMSANMGRSLAAIGQLQAQARDEEAGNGGP
jgi:DNA-binding GntR family transcriptional regulator